MSKGKNKGSLRFELIGISFILCSVFFYISLLSEDAGIIGKFVKQVLLGLFGIGAYVFPLIIVSIGIAVVYLKANIKMNKKFYAFSLSLLALLISLFLNSFSIYINVEPDFLTTIETSYQNGAQYGIGGGATGALFGYALIKLIGMPGSIALVVTLFIISIILFTEVSSVHFFDFLKETVFKLFSSAKKSDKGKKTNEEAQLLEENDFFNENEGIDDGYNDPQKLVKKIKILDFTKNFDKSFIDKESKQLEAEAIEPLKSIRDKSNEAKQEKTDIDNKKENHTLNLVPAANKHYTNYKLPSTNLLIMPSDNKSGNTKKEVMNNAKTLDETLKNFGVGASISQVSVGPAITRYELQLNPGVKVSKIVNLSDDISLSLASAGVRIEAPIPGKAAVGIEVPNKDISSVHLREVIESDEFKNNKSKIAFAIGKDVAGASIVADLSKMPHLLIAGSTGSGKSVCINTIITSILYKASPEEVKLLMIDPKVVELSIYKNIPHLLIPVVTDPKKAAGALNWAVMEMTDRYKKFASSNVRDINGYNSISKGNIEKLPQIVVIIDELADLMMVSPGDVEDSICRLAQMARAAGIHLVVATQRPSVDVITGLIKANIPSRISFAVSSQVDSRTILDMGGAEKLLGKGDMLFFPVGESKPIRVQGAFISEGEVERLVEFIRDQIPPSYDDSIIQVLDEEIVNEEDEEVDELLKNAIEIVVENGQASILMLQRKLKVGYNRAAKLIDQMEERRIVGGYEGSKPRKVLISREQFDNMM